MPLLLLGKALPPREDLRLQQAVGPLPVKTMQQHLGKIPPPVVNTVPLLLEPTLLPAVSILLLGDTTPKPADAGRLPSEKSPRP